jgi:hypothetical protein
MLIGSYYFRDSIAVQITDHWSSMAIGTLIFRTPLLTYRKGGYIDFIRTDDRISKVEIIAGPIVGAFSIIAVDKTIPVIVNAIVADLLSGRNECGEKEKREKDRLPVAIHGIS